MAYPPPQGGYPYPPNQGGQGNVGFGGTPQPGQAPGYSQPPQGGSGGFPASQAPSNIPYPLFPDASSPYPAPSNPSPALYPGSSPYPPPPGVGSSPYPPQLGAGASPYPPQSGVGSSPYPPQPGVGSSPYPPQPGVGSSPYQPQPGVGSSPYPPQPGVGSSPYAPQYGAGSSPYPPVPQNAPYTVAGGNIPPTGVSSYQQSTTVAPNYNPGSGYSGSMWPYQERPTIRPSASYDPSADASTLRQAMKGFGTDEATIIQVLARRNSQERQRIKIGYQQSYGQDLIQKLRSEVGGDFLNVVEALMTPLPEFLAKELNEAIDGIGTKERTLVEILCASDNTAIRTIKSSYHNLYGKTLETALKRDTSGSFERLLVAMATGYRDEAGVNHSQVPGLAQTLYAAGAKELGTDEVEFIRILSNYSYPVLRCVFEEYQKVSGGKSFESAIRSEMSGDLEEGMLAIYECIHNRAAFFASHLHRAMKGAGTHDRHLIRIIVWRSEIDLGNIKDEYHKAYGRTLEAAVSKETSKDYKKILLALLQD